MANFWTKEKLEMLKTYLENGVSRQELVSKFKKSYASIDSAMLRNGLSKYVKAPETKDVINLEELDDSHFAEIKEKAKLQWNIPKTKIPTNPKKEFKTYLVVGDIHAPKQNNGALKSVFKLMDDVKFDGLINIGDHLDLACVSHWNKGKHKTLEGLRLKTDFIIGNTILDEFDKRLPKNAEKHFCVGNHELWLDQLIDEIPALDDLFSLDAGLKLSERGYKIYPYNEIVKFGKLRITHGFFTGANPAKTTATKFLANTLVGHVHSPEMGLIHTPAKECSVVGYVNGCLCDLSPDYAKGKPNSWSHGISVLYLFPDGYFDVTIIRIVKNRFVFNNKVYSGK